MCQSKIDRRDFFCLIRENFTGASQLFIFEDQTSIFLKEHPDKDVSLHKHHLQYRASPLSPLLSMLSSVSDTLEAYIISEEKYLVLILRSHIGVTKCSLVP